MNSTPDLSPWSGLELLFASTGGARSAVWRGRLEGRDVAIRSSRRSTASVDWELDLMASLAADDFVVPSVVKTDDGRRHADGLIVQEWLGGDQPRSEADWIAVAAELRRLHRATVDHHQRPGCCRGDELGPIRRSVDADLDRVPTEVLDRLLPTLARSADAETAVIHGDPGPGNIRIDATGRVGLLDWDESRVDAIWHDLSNLGVVVLDPADHDRATELSHAWEALNGWVAEPGYARRRLAQIRSGPQ